MATHRSEPVKADRTGFRAPGLEYADGLLGVYRDPRLHCTDIAFRDIKNMRYYMKAVAFTPAASRQWLKLSADIRKRIDGKLTIYATNGSGDVKRLKGTVRVQNYA